eukprot:scaffold60834_cov44-Attheya_sp.AAC.4
MQDGSSRPARLGSVGTSTMASSSLLVHRRNGMSSCFVWVALVCLWVMAVPEVHALSNKNAAAASTTTTLIQVCQNKDCCKRFARSTSSSLVEIMENLVPPCSSTTDIRVEASGCLSQCDKGPNVQIITTPKMGDSSRPQIHFGVMDVIAAASILELSLPDNFEVPSKLLAATDLLMQANEESPIRPTPPCLDWCYMQPTTTSTDSPCFGYASQVFTLCLYAIRG